MERAPVSGITFATYSAPSHSSTATASASDHAAAKEQSFHSAISAQPSSAHTPATGHDPGPVMTTLALGEEDGGGMSMAPEPGGMSTPMAGDDLQVTTLAIGEEDGGGGQFGYGSMSPIADDHSMIGGGVQTDRVSSAGMGGLPEGYGTMQPVYSPGEAEYPAFAKTSETPDLLNFHPVARIPKTQLPHSVPVSASPAPVYAPVTAQPMVMETVPIGATAQDIPLSGNYESIGSYEDYVRGLSGGTAMPTVETAPVEMQPAQTTYAPAEPIYEPVAPSSVYEAHQPAAATSVYDEMRPAAPEPVYEPVQTYEPVEIAPVETVPAEAATPVYEAAPLTSAEPQEKPGVIEKDTPFDFKSDVEPADPADGNPDYVAPAEAAGTESAPAAKPDATYVEVPLDAYLVDSAGAATSETPVSEVTDRAPVEATEAAPSSDAAPSVETSAEPEPAEPKAPEKMSLGGSFIVMDQPLPDTMTGASSGMGSAGPEAATAPEAATETGSDTPMPDTSGDDLRIMTLAIGEESGS